MWNTSRKRCVPHFRPVSIDRNAMWNTWNTSFQTHPRGKRRGQKRRFHRKQFGKMRSICSTFMHFIREMNTSLQLDLIVKLRRQPSGFVGRCPACAEVGQDNGGNHLIIWPDGRFACVCHPGYQGREHRKRIFFLVGNKQKTRSFNVSIQPSLL